VQYRAAGAVSACWLLTSGRQLTDGAGNRNGALLVASDITAQKDSEGRINELNRDLDRHVVQLQVLLREKTLLLQEVQHRVKNNLQVVSSLAYLQAGKVASSEAKSALMSMRDRAKSMALIHEHLCFSNVLTEIDFGRFVEHLAPPLIQAYASLPDSIRLHIDADVKLRLDEAIPCGLILNELLSNALKHAFRDVSEGNLWVAMRQEMMYSHWKCAMTVQDCRPGFPALRPPRWAFRLSTIS
jgi:two-component sensor histidine kinase